MTTVGSLIWNIILVYLGVIAGASWGKIITGTDIYTKITIIILCATILIAAFILTRRNLKSKHE